MCRGNALPFPFAQHLLLFAANKKQTATKARPHAFNLLKHEYLPYRSDGSPELARGVEDLKLLEPSAEVVLGQVSSGGGEPGVLAGLRRGDSPLRVHGKQLPDQVLQAQRTERYPRRRKNKLRHAYL